MPKYPIELTTSDWVDYLDTLTDRDEKIIALATYHRRIEHDARHAELAQLSHEDAETHALIRKVADAAAEKLADHVTAHDYHPLGLPVGRQ